MRILVLEYAVGIKARVDVELFSEGFAMLRSIIEDFERAGFEVITTLNRSMKRYAPWFGNATILFHDQLNKAFEMHPHAALVIAPTQPLNSLSRSLSRSGIRVLGSKPETILVAGDKWRIYQKLYGVVRQPVTKLSLPPEWTEYVRKPRDGEGCSGVALVKPLSKGSPPASASCSPPFVSKKKITPKEYATSEKLLYQEYIPGKKGSACILAAGNRTTVLSINEQIILSEKVEGKENEVSFSYSGSLIPGCEEVRNEVEVMAKKVVRACGAEGLCGIDFAISESSGKLFFLELNPRITTSFVGLSRIFSSNPVKMLLEELYNCPPEDEKRAALPTRNVKVKSNSPKGEENQDESIRQTEGFVRVVLVKAKRHSLISETRLELLKNMIEVVSPPFCPDGYAGSSGRYIERGEVLFLLAVNGENYKAMEKNLYSSVAKAVKLLGVSIDDIDWY